MARTALDPPSNPADPERTGGARCQSRAEAMPGAGLGQEDMKTCLSLRQLPHFLDRELVDPAARDGTRLIRLGYEICFSSVAMILPGVKGLFLGEATLLVGRQEPVKPDHAAAAANDRRLAP